MTYEERRAKREKKEESSGDKPQSRVLEADIVTRHYI